MTEAHSDFSKKLTRQILIALVLGLVFGSILNYSIDVLPTGVQDLLKTQLLGGLIAAGGKMFVSALQMLVVPVVFVSLVIGVSSFKDISQLGRLGLKTFFLYMATTAVAITLAILLALLIRPGSGFELTSQSQFAAPEAPSFWQVLADIVPTNPIKAMANGDMLPLIFFSIVFGIAINMSQPKAKPLLDLFQSLESIVMTLVILVMRLAPIGVFCLVAKVFADKGIAAISSLALYFFVVLAALAAHFLITYPALLKLVGGLDPRKFFKKFRTPIVFAFSTSSSNATIPVTMDTVENELGVDNNVASFTVPLGATINMDGTAIMQGAATIFIAQAYGIDLSLGNIITVVATAVLASVGTAGVPGVGLVMLAMVLKSVGLPVEGISLIIGVDRLLDMARTSVNVTGDAVITCVVAQKEKMLDKAVFDS